MFKEKSNLNQETAPVQTERLTQEEQDFEAEERAAAAADRFDEVKESGEFKNMWLKNYKQDPTSFFSKKNFDQLKLMDGSERLYLLSRVSSSIMVTAEMAKEYYKEFPDDLASVNYIFRDRKWVPNDQADYNLFTISALEADKDDLHEEEIVPGYKILRGNIEQYYNIARRRREAPKFLLSNFKEVGLKEDFAEFGEAAKALLEVEKNALSYEYTSENFINAKEIFSQEFERLSEEDKALFLRKCLAHSQYHLLFNEVYNSCFTPESVKYFSESKKGHYDVAHSMIYKTYQPQKVYDYDSGAFDYEMNSSSERGGDVEEYADQKIILAVLGRLKDVKADQDENTKLVVEFWNKNRNPIFANAVAGVLSEQNVNLAASQLLELLHSEKEKKEPITAMLYRLEFGKIGVSAEGVKYLEKIYDLGEYNNPTYHANRLTVNGEIGVFNEELELIKYFHLGKLDSEDKKVKADVLDFTYETLFIGSDKESPEEKEKREKYLEEFRKKYYQISEDDMFQETGTRLNNLSFKKQGWFLVYLNQANIEEKQKLRNFVSKYHEDGINSFLSLEIDQSLGGKIISLGEKINNVESAQILFNKISEITDLAEKESNEIKEMFLKDGTLTGFDWREVRLALLNNVKDIIVKFEAELGDNGEEKNVNTLLRELETSRTEMKLLAGVLKVAKENGENIPIESIRDITIERKVINNSEGVILSDMEKESLIKIAEENYSAIFLQPGDNYNPEAYNRVISNFTKELENLDGQLVDILKYKGDVACFDRFKQISAHEVYGGSFNVIKDIQGLSVGKSFLKKMLEDISQDYNVHIKSRQDNPANNAYEHEGFVIVGEHQEKDGVAYYDMVKPSASSLKKIV